MIRKIGTISGCSKSSAGNGRFRSAEDVAVAEREGDLVDHQKQQSKFVRLLLVTSSSRVSFFFRLPRPGEKPGIFLIFVYFLLQAAPQTTRLLRPLAELVCSAASCDSYQCPC